MLLFLTPNKKTLQILDSEKNIEKKAIIIKKSYLCPENKKITIMTQILVTLNEDATTLHVRKAIELLRGVASVKVFKGNAEKVAEKRRQEAYVKESLTRAFDEVKRARRGEHKMMTDEEFMAELKAEGIA